MNLTHHLIVGLGLFALGAAVGSFANVCIHRIPRGLNVIRPRSRCPGCLGPIASRDNIPILSWLLLRGRCRHCGLSISPVYPLVEALVGLMPAAAYLAEAWSTAGDPFEQGPLALACRLLGRVALLAALVAVAFAARDVLRGLAGSARRELEA